MSDILMAFFMSFIIFYPIILAEVIICMYVHNTASHSLFNPKTIYKETDLNWFGSIMRALFCGIFLFPIAIWYWFRWLCTVGKKEEK